MNTKHLTSVEYSNLVASTLFSDPQTDRCFALISGSQHTFKFAWQSTIVSPEILEIGDGRYCIGIDQNFAIVDLQNGTVLLNLELQKFFYEVKIHRNAIYVMSEIEFIRIDKAASTVISSHGLPDIYSTVEFTEDTVTVTCLDGQIVEI